MNMFGVCAVTGWFAVITVASASFNPSQKQFIPQVAFQCGYRNRYLSKTGEWVTDNDPNAVCLRGKLDILKYCQRSYPDVKVTNIVESAHHYQIDDWCKAAEGKPCKWTFWVQPYRCLIGEFESEALLVPKDCNFGHVDDQTMCEDFAHWNTTAHRECASRKDTTTTPPESMSVHSFAILEPCGLDMFAGVEYVCCGSKAAKAAATDELAAHVKASIRDYHQTEAVTTKTIPNKTSDWWDEAEQDIDDNADTETTDPYLRVADPDNEHERYKSAVKRLQERHREKQAKIMKEWSELETDYEKIKAKDPKQADAFQKKMTERYQQTVAALEKQTHEQRVQLDTVHQQRVRAALNERKRENIKAYRDAMSEPKPSTHKIMKTLEAYIRSEEKDRLHNINHYRHLLRSEPDAALAFRGELLKRMSDIDLRVNATLEMLVRVKDLMPKLKPVALEFWQSYRLENTPDFIAESLVWIGTTENNVVILDKFDQEAKEVLGGTNPKVPNVHIGAAQSLNELLKESNAVENKLEKQLGETKDSQPHVVADAAGNSIAANENVAPHAGDSQHHEQTELNTYVANALKNSLQHEPNVREELIPQASSHGMTVVLIVGSIAGLVAVIVGMIVWRVKTSARGQGFIEVDACTPEERHVAAMQVNGYENPTYNFFEKA